VCARPPILPWRRRALTSAQPVARPTDSGATVGSICCKAFVGTRLFPGLKGQRAQFRHAFQMNQSRVRDLRAVKPKLKQVEPLQIRQSGIGDLCSDQGSAA